MILIESKRKKYENILKKHPDAIIADVTSHAKDSLIKLSPFYPPGGIPVPFSDGVTATCVEALEIIKSFYIINRCRSQIN